jgi:hypothetical protein
MEDTDKGFTGRANVRINDKQFGFGCPAKIKFTTILVAIFNHSDPFF